MSIFKRKAILIGLSIFVVCGVLIFAADLNRDMRQKLENIRRASSVYDREGRLVGNLYFYNRIWISFDRIPKNVKNAVVAIEDSRFYQHNGIDLKGMARAFVHNITPGGGAMEGGSTITQQLAKISLLTSERTLSRKVQDINYALQIEKVYTKDEILELYLNSIYLAHGNLGIEAASRFYFNKSVSQLGLPESALLAGLIQSPENYSPVKNPKKARNRRNTVLLKMMDQNYITKAQYDSAVATPIKIVKRTTAASTGAYFLDYIKEYLIKNEGFTEEQLRFGGYKIYSTLDLSCQREAEKALTTLPKVPARSQPQGALITIDPKTGGILAMVGGTNYSTSQYNRTVLSHRQPGSAIKPFVYATALEQGFTAATIFDDKPLVITLPDGKEWKPENYDRQYRGRMTLRAALRDSVNSVAIQLLQEVGIEAVANQMEQMGITSLVKKGKAHDLHLAPLSLGGLTKGVTPMELALAYAPFANEGNYAKPFPIVKIADRHGNLLKEFKSELKPVLSPQTAYIITMLMKDVVDQGTGRRAKLPDRPAAGKTGTSSDYTNAWFVGYTPEMLTVVWVGNDRQDQPMIYTGMNIGSSTATGLWGTYMKAATRSLPASDYPEPPGIVWASVDPSTGEAVPDWSSKETYQEVFNENNVPKSSMYRIWRWFFPGKKEDGSQADGSQEPIESETEEKHGEEGFEESQPDLINEFEQF
ncbi:MAG: PBP1A family penicillin-binding protein [Firmicutes bacterium]|nr:PBP1A family penicillin-binding protein [Bacillota bacterium]